jgi:hypothetical protein
MKLKIKFRKETRFDLPCRPMIRTWAQLFHGTRYSLRALALAEKPKPITHDFD